jgi:hypothetical protein
VAPDVTDPRRPPAAPPARAEGTIVPTVRGPAVITGSGGGGQTVVLPDGTTGLIAPGSNAVLRPDGTTIPLAR